MSIDRSVAVIGSSNLDIRSFALNAELMLLVFDPSIAASLVAEQDRYIGNSTLLTQASWDDRSFGKKLPQNLARLLSPLL